MMDGYATAKARRKDLIELIVAAADEIAEIDMDLLIKKSQT
jgi:hypothetical protein